MSLDVSLYGEEIESECTCPHCDNKHTHKQRIEHYSSNITHNLTRMAADAGIYMACWHPDEIGITKASQLIEPLAKAVELMEADPPRFEKHNAPNGWGKYEHFLPWVRQYLVACRANPEANVSVSR